MSATASLARPRASAALDGPIAATMLRLGLPTLVVLAVQALVGVAETWFVSGLGTEALAGVALVFPVLMLMLMMANGGIGGGVSSAIARALGAGREDEARALLFHALALAVSLGLAFTALALAAGPALYRAMGAQGGALDAALTYSNAVFLAAVPAWLTALLAAALRGAGDVRRPAAVILVGALALLALSPALIFGWGPFPRLGVAGAGIAVALYYAATATALLAHLLSRRASVRLAPARIAARHLRAILVVGGLSAIGTIQANLTVALVTGAVGRFGTEALAGYGIAARLDYLLIPLLFGFGTAAVTMVGMNVGAGHVVRARRVAWIAAAIGGGATGAIGLAAALFPEAWAGLFSDEPAVRATAALYLRVVAPFYGPFGAAYMLYFASQGAGRVLWPVAGGTARLLIAGVGGAMVAAWTADLGAAFAVVAAGSIAFFAICVLAVRAPAWGTPAKERSDAVRLERRTA